ncbi:MAG: hypothetical protein LC102_03145 [Ignavibacteriales bacterium]|nr:hypothetical protein [Ignavibacteriales bacterium]WKZ73576.1 MAG: hypothetical protein QY308_05080 [Ignavibacteriaceae bacterium]
MVTELNFSCMWRSWAWGKLELKKPVNGIKLFVYVAKLGVGEVEIKKAC